MELRYNQFGNLEPGTYEMEWDEFKNVFGISAHRCWLIEGMEFAIDDLKTIGCTAIYIDGSFVTKKIVPTDYDLCWEDTGISLVEVKEKCYPLVDGGWKMQKIKERYRGDVAPASNIADMKKCINFLGYYTEDKQGRNKGIIKVKI